MSRKGQSSVIVSAVSAVVDMNKKRGEQLESFPFLLRPDDGTYAEEPVRIVTGDWNEVQEPRIVELTPDIFSGSEVSEIQIAPKGTGEAHPSWVLVWISLTYKKDFSFGGMAKTGDTLGPKAQDVGFSDFRFGTHQAAGAVRKLSENKVTGFFLLYTDIKPCLIKACRADNLLVEVQDPRSDHTDFPVWIHPCYAD